MQFLNLSNRSLSEDEIQILEHGSKYSFPVKPNLKSIFPEFENIVQSTHNDYKKIYKVVYHEINKLIKQPIMISKDEMNILKKLK